MRYRRLILAVPVLACTIAACGETADPTSPATPPVLSANRLVRTDTLLNVSATAPHTTGADTNTGPADGAPIVEERNPGTIGSGN